MHSYSGLTASHVGSFPQSDEIDLDAEMRGVNVRTSIQPVGHFHRQ
jgi:hypothetical protein